MKTTLLSIILILSVTPAFAAVKGESVTYKSGDTILKGYIAYDDTIKGKRPGVIVVPDWWGEGKFVRNRADALASLGYTAMVMDMYGNGKYVDSAKDAENLMNQFTADPEVMKSRFLATKDTLSSHKTVDARHIGAVGYSLGGLVVLEMARNGTDLDGVASLWGVISKPAMPAKKGNIKAKVLVLQPEKDGWAPEDALKALKSEMISAGADYRLIAYPNTRHAFSRPDADERAARDNLPIRYDANADKNSWDDLSAFLKTAFK